MKHGTLKSHNPETSSEMAKMIASLYLHLNALQIHLKKY